MKKKVVKLIVVWAVARPLSLSVTTVIYRYLSLGNSYSHKHTIRRLKVDADLSYANWLLSYTTMMSLNSWRARSFQKTRSPRRTINVKPASPQPLPSPVRRLRR